MSSTPTSPTTSGSTTPGATPRADLGARVDALEEAAGMSRGRLDDRLVDEVEAVAARATERIRLSASHTVVGIAGATGSGKSSTFNALTGLDLSSVGVRRPTTSWAAACIWGSEDVTELMEWLGIAPRHQTTRDSMLDTSSETRDMDGVVLLDLPDHDSTEVSHHLEVDRLVTKADLLVWVLDPQKYADAALHDRYFKPYVAQQDVMLVVLNQIDSVPEERREAMLADVRKLLDDDGLNRVPIVPVSAREGWGIDVLRAQVIDRVAAKKAVVARIDADIVEAAERLAEATGTARAPELPDSVAEELREAVVVAAGIPPLVEGVETVVAGRTRRATASPPLTWFGRDPLRRVEVDLGEAAGLLTGGRLPEAGTVQRSRVEVAARTLGDRVSEGLVPAWAEAVQGAATRRVDEVVARVDRALGDVDLGATRVPGWARAVQALQWVLLVAFVAGIGWGVAALVGAGVPETSVAGIPLGFGVAVLALVVSLVLTLVGRSAAAGAGSAAAAEGDGALREASGTAVDELVLRPVREELDAYRQVRQRISSARVRR
ncbi:GTPase [Nocardioides zeae]|uniref:GTPase n=1 Tax=Nocardioides imazamoxiresistens TaxID=3231893 RepID=A0ABU3PRP2_9ACTN|nr:GTPase [Nocardioides zeae]MDT9591905.1 GTPase [Nocardioides zeae]